MTLHEAIERILQESERAMTAVEIAHIVNERKLYARKDGLPVSPFQINTRVGNHENIFGKEHEKIILVKDDLFKRSLRKFQSIISQNNNKADFQNSDIATKAFIAVLDDLMKDDNDDVSENTFQNSSA